MKNSILYLSAILLYFLGTSCDYERIRADHEVNSRTYNFSEYTGLKVSDAFDVYVTFSDTEEKIVIEANNNLHEIMEVTKTGDFLNIGLERHTNIRGDVTLNAYITTKNISDFEVSGASRIELVNDMVANNGVIELSGASSFYGGVLSDHLKIKGSGASSIDLFGSVDRLDATLSGSSDIKDFDLMVNYLDLDLSGASSCYLSVEKSIDYRGSGASTLYYKGNPSMHSVNVTGASQIIKRN